MPIGFGNNTNMGSAKYIPYLYDRIKSIVQGFINNSELLADGDNVLIPTDAQGDNPVFTNSDNTFRVFYGGINQTSNWAIDVLSETNVTTSQVDNTISITAISDDEGEYTVRGIRADYTTITKVVKVYKARLSGQGVDGLGWTGGAYNSGNGIVTFTSTDGLGFSTTDLRGVAGSDGSDGLGWTSGSYDSGTGIVTFTSADALGFTTGDLRGADGADGGGTFQDTNYSIIPTDVDGTLGAVTPGLGSVDLQTFRSSNPSYTASGDHGFIAGGINNQADGDNDFVAGWSNIISSTGGSNAINGGNGNTIDGGSDSLLSAINGGGQNTISSPYSSTIGSYHTITNPGVISSGLSGVSSTNGEFIISTSNSPVQKSIFILEEQTSATGTASLQTLGRNSGAPTITPQNIQVINSTSFSGTLDLTGFQNDGSLWRKKFVFSYWCNGSGTVSSKQLVSLSDYENSGDGFATSVNIVTTTLNEIEVQISPTGAQGAVSTNWVGIVEGIIMDI